MVTMSNGFSITFSSVLRRPPHWNGRGEKAALDRDVGASNDSDLSSAADAFPEASATEQPETAKLRTSHQI
jgi:hypothetical protein